MTPKTRPGDLVFISAGSLIEGVIDNSEEYFPVYVRAIVISSPIRYIENDYDISGLVMVMIPNMGPYLVQEKYLMTPDEYVSHLKTINEAVIRLDG